MAVVGEQLLQAAERFQERGLLVAGELDQEQRLGRSLDVPLERGAEDRKLAGQIHHRAIHQLDGRRPQLDDEARHVHGIVEAVEMADRTHSVLRDPVQLQLDPGEEAERPFRADQQLGQVGAPLA